MINISWVSCFFKFFIRSLFLVNGPQALYVNPGYLKCISGINLSPANKNVFTISFKTKKDLTKEFDLKVILIPRILNNPLGSFSLRNSKFFTISHWTFW